MARFDIFTAASFESAVYLNLAATVPTICKKKTIGSGTSAISMESILFWKTRRGQKLQKGTYMAASSHVVWVGDFMVRQYCYYLWKNELNDKLQRDYAFMEWNRSSMVRCLVCNVNLCPNCINELHGVDMQGTNRLLGQKR